MKSGFHAAALCFCMSAASATGATVSNVGFSQDPQTFKATVTYRIDEPAIITVDVRTNRGDGVYATIGADKLRRISGEVNKFVTNVNTSVSATWPIDSSMPEQTISAARIVVTAWATNAPPDYMAINLIDTDVVRYYVSADAFPVPVTNGMYKTDWLVMRRIPAAGVRWHMDCQGQNDHVVSLPDDYYIGIYEFTVGQWMRCGVTASLGGKIWANGKKAAPGTSYDKLRGPSAAINELRSFLGIDADLPTEEQWEYACRAGTGTAVYGGGVSSEEFIRANAWYRGNCDRWSDTEVGMFSPNPWGLYDMYGGQMEMCLDMYDAEKRVVRSACYTHSWDVMTSSWRGGYAETTGYDNIGFRLVAPCRAPLKAK